MLLSLVGVSAHTYAAVNEKSSSTKPASTAKSKKSAATTKKTLKPTAKNTNKAPARTAKTNKTAAAKTLAKTKAAPTKTKDDIAWAQGVGAISKFKPDGSKPYYKQFEDYVREVIAPRVPGAALTMVADGQVQVLEGFGNRAVGSTLPVNADTVFRLASVSKTFASGAAAIAVRDKLLSWDTTVQSKVPYVEFSNPNYGRQLTLKDILAQRSGLPKHT